MNLEGTIVAVTGGGSGIGQALAVEAVARGASAVAVLDVDADAADAAARSLSSANGVRARAYAVDVADVDATATVAQQIVEELGTPGLLCANAGVFPEGAPLLDAEPGDFGWALSVNVIGTWSTLRAFGVHMARVPDPGWMLVTASEHSVGVPFAGNGVYTTTKHAVLGLADVLRRELPEHLGISAMVPGLVSTGLWRSGRNRPDTFGGPRADSDFAQQLLGEGMEAGTVARLALDGVERETFLIATHSHVQQYADARSHDVTEAFAALAASGEKAVSYDATEIIAQMEDRAPE